MASLHMGGCHPLDEGKIDKEVGRVSPGNYALGCVDDSTFIALYVGRSDSDVNDRLQSWLGVRSTTTCYGLAGARAVGIAVHGGYTHFLFSYASTAQAAFEKECRNYHDFGGSYGLDNERHPAPPEGESWKCPLHGHHHTYSETAGL